MFDKLKQLNELRKLQKQIKEQRVEVEKNGVRVVMRGDFEVEQIRLNPNLDLRAQEKALMAALNDARSQMQQILAKNFAGSLSL